MRPKLLVQGSHRTPPPRGHQGVNAEALGSDAPPQNIRMIDDWFRIRIGPQSVQELIEKNARNRSRCI